MRKNDGNKYEVNKNEENKNEGKNDCIHLSERPDIPSGTFLKYDDDPKSSRHLG